MNRADCAFTAGGTTLWEALYMGLPCISTILTENQRSNAEWLGQREIVINLGWYLELSVETIAEAIKTLVENKELRLKMSVKGAKLIDGEGAGRVVMHLKNEGFYLSRAREDDCELLYLWANEPSVREASFNSDPIGWYEHRQWFRGKIEDPSCTIFIAADQSEQPLGMARFEIKVKEAVISVSLDSKVRGRGLGAKLIEKASKKMMILKNIDKINAYIKIENAASVNAFTKAGYRNPVNTIVMNYPAYRMIYP